MVDLQMDYSRGYGYNTVGQVPANNQGKWIVDSGQWTVDSGQGTRGRTCLNQTSPTNKEPSLTLA